MTIQFMAKIPWESGEEKGDVTVNAIIKGPILVTKDVSKKIDDLLKHEYGAWVKFVQTSEETHQPAPKVERS